MLISICFAKVFKYKIFIKKNENRLVNLIRCAMLKKTNINYLIICLIVFIFLSCQNINEPYQNYIYPETSIWPGRLYFGDAVLLNNTTTGGKYFNVNQITECNISDTINIAFACVIVIPDPHSADQYSINNIPKLNVKVTSLIKGDTENYELFRNEAVDWTDEVRFNLVNSPPNIKMRVFELVSLLQPIIYESNEAIINDGLLTVSPQGDQLIAEVVFKGEKYTAYLLDIKPE